MNKRITVGIPTFNAENTLVKALSSIVIQSVEAKVILGIDDGKDYSSIIAQFPSLDIKQVGMEESNAGPGVARQRCLNACDTEFITFMDADDVFYTPLALQQLLQAIDQNDIVVSQGGFVSEGYGLRNDPGHPWVFGRLYRTDFLKSSKISFSKLRAMEDGEFNAKIRMFIEGTPLKWNIINEPIYLWNPGSEHSITRTGAELDIEGKPKGVPLYNYGLCPLGSCICFKNAIDFVKKTNPFNPSLMKTATEIFVGQYFQYFETIEIAPIYKEQSEWVARWFYWNCFIDYSNLLTEDILNQIALPQFGRLHKMPTKTFNEWLKDIIDKGKPELSELESIRSKLPKEVTELEDKTGVVGNITSQF